MEICAVVVTYNRIDKLKKALACYANQTKKVDKLVLVDNGSNSETKKYINEWIKIDDGYKKFLVSLETNTGGSGGFFYGMKKAQEIGYDYIYLADDDLYLENDVFEKFVQFTKKHNEFKVFCLQEYNSAGIIFSHRAILKKKSGFYFFHSVDVKSYDKEYFFVDLFSFAGAFIHHSVVDKYGYPKKEYFIWFDDAEYSLRIIKTEKIVCVPNIKAYHDLDEKSNELSWKMYYGMRNLFDLYRTHFSKIVNHLFLLRFYIKNSILFFTNKKLLRIRLDGYKDFKRGRFGISEKYKPGTKI